jgi:hypothetical protein
VKKKNKNLKKEIKKYKKNSKKDECYQQKIKKQSKVIKDKAIKINEHQIQYNKELLKMEELIGYRQDNQSYIIDQNNYSELLSDDSVKIVFNGKESIISKEIMESSIRKNTPLKLLLSIFPDSEHFIFNNNLDKMNLHQILCKRFPFFSSQFKIFNSQLKNFKTHHLTKKK